ncbi:hypothetical protein AAFG07_19655 [Bradyrhizobium sp. B097]|uniref:hypothetical protein n=1 Tax=Bradyrhizobium sp. B097 TaxID=3140244 RepID=UPI003184579C
MNMHHRFETARPSTGRESTVRKMLSDLVLACQQIEVDIATEEARAGIYDRSNPRYPILARSLHERHDNLKGTIATLEMRATERPQHKLVTGAA